MKSLFFVLLLSCQFALNIQAQAPKIQSMVIDEQKSILTIRGSFGPILGRAFCDSVELAVFTWTDTLIKAIFPDSGRGSAGPVTVEINSTHSNIRTITRWQTRVRYRTWGGGDLFNKGYYVLDWRFDLHSNLCNDTYSIFSFSGMKTSSTHQSSTGVGLEKYDTVASFYKGYFLNSDRIFHMDLPYYPYSVNGHGNPDAYIVADSQFILLRGGRYDGGLTWSTVWDSSLTFFPPPQNAFALQGKPVLIAPPNNKVALGYRNVQFSWSPIDLMDSYRIQLFSDSSLKVMVFDSVVTSTAYSAPGLDTNARYFWRVRGVNQEGEGAWSAVWNFTTGNKARVSYPEKHPFNLSLDQTTIQGYIPNSGLVRADCIDMIGRIVSTFLQEQPGPSAIELPISAFTTLPGVYMIRVIHGDQIETIKVRI